MRQPPLHTDTYSTPQADRILASAATGTTLAARFDHTLLATLRYTGLRNDELVNLRTHNLDLDAATLHVVGKGRKARTIPLPACLVTTLRRYLSDVRPQLPASPYLLASPRSQNNGGHIGRISNRSVHAAIRRLGQSANVPGRHHPHRWRHAYATGLLRAGVSLEHIRLLLGHASIATTVRYLHLDLADLASAVNHTFDNQ